MMVKTSARRRVLLRSTVTFVVSAALVVGGAVPAQASPRQQAAERAASTLAEVTAAAQGSNTDDGGGATTPDDVEVGSGSVKPGDGSTVTGDEVGTSVTFGGKKDDGALDVTMSKMPDSAAVSAASETGGTVVSAPVKISAVDGGGKQVTTVEADVTTSKTSAGTEGVTDVKPGVALSMNVDQSKLDGIDPASLQIFTRENPGDPWMPVASHYEAGSGAVVGESGHLSQFVVIGKPFVPPVGPVVVLDPDDGVAHTDSPAKVDSELPYNIALANGVKTLLQNACLATVSLTRSDPNTPYVSAQDRADFAAAQNPVLTATLAFDAPVGHAWGNGSASTGGSKVFPINTPESAAVSDTLVNVLPGYTTMPAKIWAAEPAQNIPQQEFVSNPGAYTHLEAANLDNNYDWTIIDQHMDKIAAGVAESFREYLVSQGYNCLSPAAAGFPEPPTDAEKAAWADLGHQNYEMYGSEPVSFSTGNLIEDEAIFTLPGNGGSQIDLGLTYNGQDGRLSRIGAGWSFGLGARAQKFSDGSVMIVRGDGASYTFAPNGAGGYAADPVKHQSLTEVAGQLTLAGADGSVWTFDATDPQGVGELSSFRDLAGNGYDIQYGAASENAQFLPMASITDTSGQVIQVGSDDLGRVASFTAPDSRVWGFSYGDAGDLAAIVYPGGSGTRSFTYDGAHHLLTATDPVGVTYLTNEYDAQGRVIRQLDAQGNVRSFAYDSGKTSYTDNEGDVSVFAFDDKHRVTKVTDATGGSKTYAYDDANNVTAYTDEAGNAYGYTYDANGNVTQITAPDGTTTKYTYSPTGQVASSTDQGGPGGAARTTTYDIDAKGLITGVHLPDGSTLANGYDAAGNLTSATDAGGNTTTYAYDGQGHLTSATDANGHTTTYGYNPAGLITSSTDATGATSSYAYDGAGNVSTATDPAGGVTSYVWDGNRHLLNSTDPTGAVTSYTWDALFRLASVTASDGGVTTYSYNKEDALVGVTDPVGAVTKFDVDKLSRPTTVTDPNGGAWKRAYDPLGQITESTNPAGATTKQSFDKLGRVTSTTDALGNVSKASYDKVGQTTATTDAAGNVTAYAYDVLGRVSSITNPAGDKSTFDYDKNGRVTSTTDTAGRTSSFTYDASGNVLTATDATGAKVSYGYDAANRLTTATDALGRVSTAAYDPRGLVTSATDPLGAVTAYGYDGDGRTTSVTDPNGHTATTAYDPMGRVTAKADALGNTSRFAWDAASRQTSMTNPLGVVTNYSYDPAGQLTTVVEAATGDGTQTAASNVTTSYAYDKVGNRTSATDANGNVDTLSYDKNNRVVGETNAAGNTWSYNYDSLGQLTSQLDAKGNTKSNTYNPLGQLINTAYNDGTSVAYAYDKAGQPIAMTDSLGVTGWKYDPAGRMTEQIDPQGKKVAYAYDTTGALTDLTLPGGDTIGYSYDKAGRPSKQTSPWGDLSYDWDPAGNLTTETRSTGITTSFAYDEANRVTSIANQLPKPAAAEASAAAPAASGSDSLPANNYLGGRTTPAPTNPVADGGALSFAYSYDKNSNVTAATRTVTPNQAAGSAAPRAETKRSYSYDSLDRLTGSTSTDGSKADYAYDANGNRTAASETDASGKTTSSVASFNSINQVTSTTGSTPSVYGYDANGQRTSSTVGGVNTDYSWSDAGRMTGVSRDGRSTTYGYDGLGRQQTSTDTSGLGSQTTTSVWSGTSIVQQSNPASGTTAQVRDALGGVALQASDMSTADTGTRWNLLDNLGSVAAQAVGGSVTQLANYDDFGGQNFGTTGWNAVAGFGSEQSDPSYDLNSYFSRQYDPGTGSWLSQDSYRGLLTEPQSVNRYAFVTNNPATLSDVLGYRPYNPQGITKPNLNSLFYVPQPWHPPMAAPSSAEPAGASFLNSSNPGFGSGGSSKKGSSRAHPWDPSSNTKYVQKQHKNEGNAQSAQILRDVLLVAAGIAVGAAVVACIAATAGICGAAAAGVIVGAGVVAGAGTGAAIVAATPGGHETSDYVAGAATVAVGAVPIPGLGAVKAGEGVVAPAIKAGTAGGETAGKAFPTAIKDAAKAENPGGVCVYCHMDSLPTQVDHAIPKAKGGNATLDNAQLACTWCNPSKGSKSYPANPPPGYEGDWPPPWWH
ncbi:RHS repeat-associated core domain-containing protein [Agreia bicolorata]|uniref:RHS repeat-associated core domain-containing protein n=1 Tax=Agreia bicolorata TaxID=110935 RepID=UPI0006972787|nr:RHS repeat-associated core domain-containing protein [Agreia bicolorata]